MAAMANLEKSLSWAGRSRPWRRRVSGLAAAACTVSVLVAGVPGIARASEPALPAGVRGRAVPAAGSPRVDGPSFPATPAGAQAEWVVKATGHLPVPVPEVRAHFDMAYLSVAPPVEVNMELEKVGPVTLQKVTTSLKTGLVALVETKTGTLFTMSLVVDINGKIRALVFQPYTAAVTSWAEVDRAVRSVAPKVGMLVASVSGSSCRPVHAIDPKKALPLGSASSLYVLDALAGQIDAGKVSWIKRIAVTGKLRSLPPGVLQTNPNGTRLTVQAVASRMIANSDNTAADMLVALAGRRSVEAAVRNSGAAKPALNVPFLTTREMFALKGYGWPKLAERYLALPAGKRQNFLTGTVDRIRLSEIRRGASSWTTPRDVTSLGWFASATDVCHVFARLASFSRKVKSAPVGAILATNDGGLALNASRWKSVWFKGGSEPGVLTLNYMATTNSGHSYVVSVLAANPSHTIAPTATSALIGAIGGAFQLAAR